MIQDTIYKFIANRLLPKRLIYWVFLKGIAVAITRYDQREPTTLQIEIASISSLGEILRQLDKKVFSNKTHDDGANL
jgi:hypothetical protein